MLNNAVIHVPNFSLSLHNTSRGQVHYIFEPGSKFVIEKPGIYTLEGDNQSGKSSLIKLIMGMASATSDKQPLSGIFCGKKAVIRSTRDAKKLGMNAAFQDDFLIPSLTITQQYELIHGKGFFKWSKNYEVTEHALSLLKDYGEDYVPVLHKFPTQLSGGALAVARIVSAQLQVNLQVLFLDEAFSGVQRDVWPSLVEKLKAWRAAHNTTIIAVTHNDEEIAKWTPDQRLVVRNKKIISK